MRAANELRPIGPPVGLRVPDEDLMTNLRILAQTDRLRVAEGVDLADELKTEIRDFDSGP